MSTVFISHATTDAEFAHRLADDLQRLGVQVWIAPESIRPGESWVRAIERGLAESSHMVVVLTPAALESPWVKKETEVAIARERRGLIQVIPLALDVQPWEVPPLLSSYQMVSFRPDYDVGLSHLADILSVRVTPLEPVSPPRRGPPYSILPVRPAVGAIALVAALLIGGAVFLAIQGGKLAVLPPALPGMVYVPAGEFIMGSDEGDSTEQPVHTVYLDAFYIDKTEVTNVQVAQFLNEQGNQEEGGVTWLDIGDEGCLITESGGQYQPKSGYSDHPVVEVSWYGARAYCQWTGKRLPTEAEWEKAARGTDGWTYPWGEGIDCDHAQYSGCGGRTVPVGSKPKGASPYGALDMAGNVWEWVADWYDEGYYVTSQESNPRGPPSGDWRVIRGGSWYNEEAHVCAAHRYGYPPGFGIGFTGFRCAR
ncbi:MAG: TIR domain-containing protein [Anaerolineales bacterium]|nr:MAG: TIR domain-containing protein [Anaerolineales bacterium]